jgi:hypothetical protein
MRDRLAWMAGWGLAIGAAASPALADPQLVGLPELIARLGINNTPTGAGVVCAQVETLEFGNYGPVQGSAQFAGKTFLLQSGATGTSEHANEVAQNFYGNSLSIAPDVSTIYLYSAGDWLQGGFLRAGSTSTPTLPPLSTPGQVKIINGSWGGTFQSSGQDNDALRRADLVAGRDGVVMTYGMPNTGQSFPLMWGAYNGISCGLTNGTHVVGTTPVGYDGPGRQKPDIVAPNSLTSFATPFVSGAAAVLVQTARVAPGLSANPNAQRPEVIKAVLMCGTDRRPGWSNNPVTTGSARGTTATPLDPIYGADELDINLAHKILTGNEQNGSGSPPTSVNAQYRGWDLAPVAQNGSIYYRFSVPSLASKVSILATWNRTINLPASTFSLANFALRLWRVDVNGQLVSLNGNPGVPYFSGGNVFCDSNVDNVEQLYITNLQPGNYTLQVSRGDAIAGNWDVAVAWLFPNPALLGDLNDDGQVNIDDLLLVINFWGSCSGCQGDGNNDGLVNIDDLLLVINGWGQQ